MKQPDERQKNMPRILVVDDNEINCDLLARRLQRSHFETQRALGGIEALSLISSETFDLVLLDINMPDLGGISVLETTRKTYSMTQLPIIMVSANHDSSGITEAITKGANDYITKPVDFPVTLARINTHLQMRRALLKLKDSEERYALAFRGANDGLWDWDLRSGEIHFSERWKDMLGFSEKSFERDPDNWFNLVHPDEIEGLKLAIEEHLLGQTAALKHEYRALHADGMFRWILTRGVASRGEDGQAIRISGSQTDVTQTKTYDPITSLPNEFLFMDRMESLMSRGRSSAKTHLAVLLIKIDRLNELRQTLGPVMGEYILIETAKRLTKGIETSQMPKTLLNNGAITISRHDQADFAVLLEDCFDETSAPKISEYLENLIQEPLTVGDQEIILTCSVGAITTSAATESETSAKEIIAQASAALTRAQAKGSGLFELFDKELQTRALKQLEMETDLRRAVMNGELSLHYQPIVHMHDGSVYGCEALARWTHAKHGNVPPFVFIPLAEKCGLIDTIGDWVLEEACKQHQVWIDQGLSPIEMSVNLSVLQMQRDDIEDHVIDIIKRTNMDPSQLKLEITESIFMENIDRISAILSSLHDQGIGIAIDDFGTGFSSLSYLNRLPITHLKIDRSFISEINDDRTSQAIVKGTLLMAQSLGIAIIAEGIETTNQMGLLQQLKAEFGQGYFYSKPVPADDFAKLLSLNNSV